MRRQLVIGNWKMHGNHDSNKKLLQELVSLWPGNGKTDVAVCPPFIYLDQAVRELRGSPVAVGAQDVSDHSNGAYTGDISVAMLADLGCEYVIVGHSERRQYHAETSELVARKALAVLEQQLVPVICVGETESQRDAGEALAVIDQQLHPVLTQLTTEQLVRCVVAYEPLWAIGTGRTATPEQAQDVHEHIRTQLKQASAEIRILYGGSVKPENAAALFAQKDIDGALVGGASLKANDFSAICRAAEESGAREA